MHLKGLKMQGFKSFADTIELNFSDGITAIVGPNGSGKSNISDAVRWVLGEQSAKSLRGSKMEDVIFNGTESRKRLGFAEVSLRLDNKDRGFQADFDELTVTRKVFASGESQYFINDAPCRLKDIHEIFMDTGLGRDGYSMVGQGKIDEILSSKSEERREIFEEAAGISKYRYRKEEAERRLKHTDENLERVSDIIVELETQIEPLTKQAEKAKQYLNLRDELKLYDVNAMLRTVARSKEQGLTITEKLEAVRAQLSEVEKALSAADEAQEACYKQFEELDAAVAEKTEKRRSAEEQIVVSEREIEVLKNTIEGNLRLVERINKEAADLLAGKQAAEQNVRQQHEALLQLEQELAGIIQEKEALAAENAESTENSSEQNNEIEAIKQSIQEAFDRVSENKIKLSNLDIVEQNIKARRREMAAEIEEKEQELAAQREKGGGMLTEHARKAEFLDELEKNVSAIKDNEQALEEKLARQIAQMQELMQKTAQNKTRLHLLTEMEQSFEGYYKSVKEIMKQHAGGMLQKVGIHGPVSKLIHVDKQYASAIGAAIGGSLQNIVVDSEEDAKKSIACLKQMGAGRATFMPISAVNGTLLDVSRVRHEEGYIGLASELVSYDDCYAGIVKNLLGKTVVMDKMDRAILVSRKYKQSLRIVTLDGEIFYPGGSIAGGSEQKGSQLLGREQEMESLRDAVLSAEHTLKQMEKEKASLESEILKLSAEREKIHSVYTENKEILLVLTRDREHHELLISTLAAAIEALQNALAATEEEGNTLEAERKAAAESLSAAEAEIQNKRVLLNELEEIAFAAANKRQKMSDMLLEKGFAETAKRNEILQQKEKLSSIETEINQATTLISLRTKEAEEFTVANNGHKASIDEKTAKAEESRKEIEALSLAIKTMGVKRQEAEQRLRTLQGDTKDTRESVYNLKAEQDRLCAQLEKAENDSEAAISRLWEEYEMTYSEAEGMQQDLGTDAHISKQIASLRGRIRALGNVNVDAIEELISVTERYEFLTNQRNDLNRAKKDLLHIIDEMQSVMKKQFKEEFDKIARHFKTTFTELFGGGRADLRLEDENDVLHCGIEINVQPPGKKLQSLLLLSGGERALSAIALLFAILRIKPTPFCFLDEIEAALDENNVYRYAEFIKRFSRNTQFILVTHRRGTMECADMIYGVTMQEKGVSKLLKLDLSEIEQH